MEFRILGPLEVVAPSGPVEIPAGRQRLVLGVLLVHANRVVSADRLAELVWAGAPPPSWANSLQSHVSRLRRALGGDAPDGGRLQAVANGYRLRVEPGELDADLFEADAEQGAATLAAGDPARASRLLGVALARWRGTALTEFCDEEWAQIRRVHLDERRLVAVEDSIEARLALGEHGVLCTELEGLTHEHPLRERFWGQLMLALYRAGRQADALRAYGELRAILSDELGIDPSPGLARLELTILRQETDLDWVPPETKSPESEPLPETAPVANTPTAAPPAPAPRAPARRRVVTVVFCDVATSTDTGEASDPETQHAIVGRFFELGRTAMQRHGGVVGRSAGDTLLAVFGLTSTREDDAPRALAAVWDLRVALSGLNTELAGRWATTLSFSVGLNTGEVLASDDADADSLVGDVVNVAARLAQEAPDGEIWSGVTTADLVRDVVGVDRASAIAVKGRSEPVPAYRLTGAPAQLRPRPISDAPLVGRDRELGLLQDTFELCVADTACHLVTVLGPAGIGKSRVAHELRRLLSTEATVLSGHCLSYGEGITYWPMAELLKNAAGISDDESIDAARAKLVTLAPASELPADVLEPLLVLAGLSDRTFDTDQTFSAVRDLFESLARERPLVVVIDDAHWAEPTMLDLVDHLVDWVQDLPLLVLCLARGELTERRPGWSGGKPNAATVTLGPLNRDACGQLIAGRLATGEVAADVADEVMARVAESTDGNPLFIEQLVELLVDDGHIAQTGSRWVATTDLTALPVPATVSALLAARLDRLEPGERAVLERAAVIGTSFWKSAVVELSNGTDPSEVDRHLRALVRRELIATERSSFGGDPGYRFRHGLIRREAERAIPKAVRAAAHTQFARWLERSAGERLPGYDEILGYHLEQAFRLRAEQGPLDDEARAVGNRASLVLANCAHEARARGDERAATGMYQRAADLAGDVHDRLELLLLRARTAGEKDSRPLLEKIQRLAADAGEARIGRFARVLELNQRFTDGDDPDVISAELEPLIEAIDRDGDIASRVRASVVSGRLHGRRGRFGAALPHLEKAVSLAASHACDDYDFALSNIVLCYALLEGPTPIDEALVRAEKVISDPRLGRQMTVRVRAIIGLLQALSGDVDAARATLDDVDAALAIPGFWGAEAPRMAAAAEIVLGDLDAADRTLRRSSEQFTDPLLRVDGGGLFAYLLALRGRYDEAIAASEFAESLPRRTIDDSFMWRTGRGLALSARGEHAAAEAMAREAVAVTIPTDGLRCKGNALMGLARVLSPVDRDGAIAAATEAVEYYEAKGAATSVATANAFLAEI